MRGRGDVAEAQAPPLVDAFERVEPDRGIRFFELLAAERGDPPKVEVHLPTTDKIETAGRPRLASELGEANAEIERLGEALRLCDALEEVKLTWSNGTIPGQLNYVDHGTTKFITTFTNQ